MNNHLYLEIFKRKNICKNKSQNILKETISGLGVFEGDADCYFYFDFESDSTYNIRIFSHKVSELDKIFTFFKNNKYLKDNFNIIKKFTFIPH